jgi:hypothetical protein
MKWLMTFAFVIIFFSSLITYDIFWGTNAKERYQLESLQSRGIQSTGCIVVRDIANYTVGRGGYTARLRFEFLTPQGAYRHGIRVSDEVYARSQVGDCDTFVYLPEDPSINEFQSTVNSYSSETYWAAHFIAFRMAAFSVCIGTTVFMLFIYLISWLKR